MRADRAKNRLAQLLLLSCLATLAFALVRPAQAADTVDVQVALVHASRGEAAVAPELAPFRDALRALPFQTFTHHASSQITLHPQAQREVTLAHGIRLQIVLDGIEDNLVTLTVDVLRGARTLAHTTITRPLGKAQVLSAGPHEGGQWVVPVRATR